MRTLMAVWPFGAIQVLAILSALVMICEPAGIFYTFQIRWVINESKDLLLGLKVGKSVILRSEFRGREKNSCV